MTRLLCQEDTYRTTVTATVEECHQDADGYRVILAQTVLYPEGGGQPADTGRVAGLTVRKFYRREDGALVHLLDRPVAGEVKVMLDWPRRYDHMQQHSAQHLLTAVAQDRFGLATTAFHLGARRSDIELDCPTLSDDIRQALETAVNASIRENRTVKIRWQAPSDFSSSAVRSRGLPPDHSGRIRLVEIEGLDLNTCGGTHVAATGEIQMLKLLSSEHLRGGTRLFFVAGERVRNLLDAGLEREQALTRLLSCGPPEHTAAAERLLAENRQAHQQLKAARQELSTLLGRHLATRTAVASLHRPEADMPFLIGVGREFQKHAPQGWALLTGGGTQGVFVVVGPPDRLKSRAEALARLLGGRGGGRGGLYQGKADALEQRAAALAELQEEVYPS